MAVLPNVGHHKRCRTNNTGAPLSLRRSREYQRQGM
nr:MAG TPA: hypothetical protein [Caudoviricetes sp.]